MFSAGAGSRREAVYELALFAIGLLEREGLSVELAFASIREAILPGALDGFSFSKEARL